MRATRTRVFTAVAWAGVLIVTVVGTAFGTPPSGVVAAPILARGDFVDRVDVRIKASSEHGMVVSNARDAGEVVVQEVTIGPNGTFGWHSHPGPVVVVVKAGALTFVDAEQGTCSETTYPAGSAFVDQGQGHVHNAFNRSSSQNLVLVATYFDVAAGTSPRIDAAGPPAGC